VINIGVLPLLETVPAGDLKPGKLENSPNKMTRENASGTMVKCLDVKRFLRQNDRLPPTAQGEEAGTRKTGVNVLGVWSSSALLLSDANTRVAKKRGIEV